MSQTVADVLLSRRGEWEVNQASAVLHGDEDSAGFIRQGIEQKVQQYLPGTKDGE